MAARTRLQFVCIHGHFYQPPRENAWLEQVELQPSADPYHDWNRRITAECYAPNACARILDGRGNLARVVSNYERISYNFGPTLMTWLERNAADTYRAILEADRTSAERFSGHGCAMAQAYSHPILPLCNDRDRETQVLWGMADFRFRFGREPEGMWLPETAVDLGSLEVLARCGIRFTILAPAQAAAVRPFGERDWTDVSRERIDPQRPYRLTLPSGRKIDLFFYDGAISRAVAFENLLTQGDRFARRLLDAFDTTRPGPQIVQIATDGETYGHHHRFGEMALAYALEEIERRSPIRITNYAEYLERFPPTYEVSIVENTAWSCAHGLGRWSEDCGCVIANRPGWHQRWRAPLRTALDWLRDELAPQFERQAAQHLRDPWAARDRYVEVILDRSPESLADFLHGQAVGEPTAESRSKVLKLLELQRHTLLMYTSCGWFFDDPSGIETQQVLQYASRAAQLGEELFDEPFERGLLQRLERVPGNRAEAPDAQSIYERKVRPARFDPARVAADHVAGELFADGSSVAPSPAYRIRDTERALHETGPTRLVVGRLEILSTITLERSDLIYGFLHRGDHELAGSVRPFRGEAPLREACGEIAEAFSREELSGVRRALERHLGKLDYSLPTLSRDQQARIVDRLLTTTVEETEAVYERLYRQHASLLRFLGRLETIAPRPLRVNAELVLNTRLRRELSAERPDPGVLRTLLDEAHEEALTLDDERLGFATQVCVERALDWLARACGRRDSPHADATTLDRVSRLAGLLPALPYSVDLSRAQIRFYRLARTAYPELHRRALGNDDAARHVVDAFRSVADALRVVLPS